MPWAKPIVLSRSEKRRTRHYDYRFLKSRFLGKQNTRWWKYSRVFIGSQTPISGCCLFLERKMLTSYGKWWQDGRMFHYRLFRADVPMGREKKRKRPLRESNPRPSEKRKKGPCTPIQSLSLWGPSQDRLSIGESSDQPPPILSQPSPYIGGFSNGEFSLPTSYFTILYP